MFLSSVLLVGASPRAAASDVVFTQPPKHLRSLQVGTSLAWPQCTALSMTPGECSNFIETEITNHVVPGLKVKIQKPRTAEEFGATYHKVLIETNIFGTTIGQKGDGMVEYPLQWKGDDGFRNVGPFDCVSLDALECCNVIQDAVPDQDVNGRTIGCFVSEHGLTPKLLSGTSANVGYVTPAFDETLAKYIVKTVSMEQIESAESSLLNALRSDLVVLNETQTTGASFETLKEIRDRLLMDTRVIGDAQNLVSGIDNVLATSVGPSSFISVAALGDSISALIPPIESFDSTPHFPRAVVVIHTNSDTTAVSGIPKIGGEVHEIDTEEDVFVGGPGSSGGGAINPPEGSNVTVSTPKFCGAFLNGSDRDVLCNSAVRCDSDQDCVSLGTETSCLPECGPLA